MELMLYAKGICWIDDCRIPFVDEKDVEKNSTGLIRFTKYTGKRKELGYGFTEWEPHKKKLEKGRFPANILVSDDMLNDGVISNSSGGKGESTKNSLDRTDLGYGYKKIDNAPGLGGYGDKGTNSRYYDIDKWFENLLESCE